MPVITMPLGQTRLSVSFSTTSWQTLVPEPPPLPPVPVGLPITQRSVLGSQVHPAAQGQRLPERSTSSTVQPSASASGSHPREARMMTSLARFRLSEQRARGAWGRRPRRRL